MDHFSSLWRQERDDHNRHQLRAADPEVIARAVVIRVLLDDASVARWRSLLGIVAEPKPADDQLSIPAFLVTVTDVIDSLKTRVDRLEGLEASRRAAKDAVTDADTQPDVPQHYCQDCGQRVLIPLRPNAVGLFGTRYGGADIWYCLSCWAKRDNANARMAGRV
jgi:hypothetical protein